MKKHLTGKILLGLVLASQANCASVTIGSHGNGEATAGAQTDPNKPTSLMVDLLAQASLTTIPDTQPEFGWIFHESKRGESQSAYQIIVASTAMGAGSGTGDVWDSGKTISSDSVNVECEIPLMRGSNYYWRVRTWGENCNPSSWSKIQRFTIESSLPQVGARSVYKASANDATGYDWSGRYQTTFLSDVTPVSVVDKGGGNFFIDFGKDAFGYVTLRLNGSYAGHTLTVRFGEAAIGDSVNTNPGYTIRYSSIIKSLGNGDVAYEIRPPATTFPSYAHPINITGWVGNITPFRYIELLNCPDNVTTNDIRQHVLHVPFDENASSFTSSDCALDAVYELCKYSIKATSFVGAYVDGDRERTPYEADAYINQLCHYGVDREYTMGRYTYEYLLDHHTWPTEWRFHFPMMAWMDYLYTGNSDALVANYDTIKNTYLRIDRERISDNLFQGWPNNGTGDPSDIVDWPIGERDGNMQTSISAVINAFHYHDLRLMARIATVLEKTADATDFTRRADTIQTSFNSVFWNPGSCLYQDGESSTHISAHANFFPMAFGLVSSNRVDPVMAFLKTTRSINGRTEYMPCSVYGAQYYLEALFEGGQEDHAIFLMADNSTSRKRHWNNMMAEGSTIAMEAWGNEFKGNNDWNHAWGAAPANIIPRYVLGVKPLTAGFATTEIKPQLGSGDGTNGLMYVSGIVPTIRGPVVLDATNSPSLFRLRVDIPGNTIAAVSIPTKGFANPVVLYDGAVVEAPVVAGRLVIENVPCGTHSFWLSSTSTPDEATLKANCKESMFGDNLSEANDERNPRGHDWAMGDKSHTNTDPYDEDD